MTRSAMRAPNKHLLSSVKVRPGRRWPPTRGSVLDDRLLGTQWTWEADLDELDRLAGLEELDDLEEPTRVLRCVAGDRYLS